MRFAFCGDRKISVDILDWLITKGDIPSVLLVADSSKQSHSQELINLLKPYKKLVFFGKEVNGDECRKELTSCNLDYIIGIHFPYIIKSETLHIPKVGFLNLHPAYLPYNKGWHTPSWSILENTKYGATLHFMSEVLDEGDIVHQKEISISLDDTANSLYQKVLKLEFEVFVEAYEDLKSLNPKRIAQIEKGTSHLKRDLIDSQKANLDDLMTFKNWFNKVRAFTTNDIKEGAFFEAGGNRYYLQIKILKESNEV